VRSTPDISTPAFSAPQQQHQQLLTDKQVKLGDTSQTRLATDKEDKLLTNQEMQSQESKHPRRYCFFVPRDLDLWPFDPKINGFQDSLWNIPTSSLVILAAAILRYRADNKRAVRQTDRQTDKHPKRGVVRATWPIFNINACDHIPETAEARIARFCMHRIYQMLASGWHDGRGRVTWSVFLNFDTIMFGVCETRQFKCRVLSWFIHRWTKPSAER